jgi:hypothetical protein
MQVIMKNQQRENIPIGICLSNKMKIDTSKLIYNVYLNLHLLYNNLSCKNEFIQSDDIDLKPGSMFFLKISDSIFYGANLDGLI